MSDIHEKWRLSRLQNSMFINHENLTITLT